MEICTSTKEGKVLGMMHVWLSSLKNVLIFLKDNWLLKTKITTVYHALLLFSCPVMSNFLRCHGLQHARSPCPSPSSGVCPSSCSLYQWCHPSISSSDALFSSRPQSFPASRTFPMSHLFTSDDQNTGASASVLSVNIQGLSPLRLTGLISLLCSRDFQESSPEPQFEGINSLAFCLLMVQLSQL